MHKTQNVPALRTKRARYQASTFPMISTTLYDNKLLIQIQLQFCIMIRALRNPSCLNPWKKFQDICIYRLQQSIFKDSHEFLVNVMGKPQLAAKVTVLISYPRVINQMRRTNWKAFLVPELSTAQPPMCQRRIITPTLQGWCENSILHGCKVFSKNPHVWL